MIESESRALPEPVTPTPVTEIPADTEQRLLKVHEIERFVLDERNYLKCFYFEGDEEKMLGVDNEDLFETIEGCVGKYCRYTLQPTANSPRVLDVRDPDHEDEGDAQ